MPQVRYIGYIAVVFAVLLHLYSANPATGALEQVLLNVTALAFAMAGFWSVMTASSR